MPAQHLNLIDPALLPRRQRGTAGQVLAAGLLLVGAALLATASLGEATRQTRAARAALTGLPLPAAAPASAAATSTADMGALQTEIAQLRALHAAQLRVRGMLDAGAVGSTQGHTEVFLALARQAQAQVWITGFGVDADGQALTLEGRMTAAAMLPGYLRRLNGEERFRGRPFAQLQMRSIEPGAAQAEPLIEFALRSQPATGAAR